MAKTHARRDEYGLTDKQRQVLDLYRGGPDEVRGNATASYRAVYPRSRPSTAASHGSRLVNSDNGIAYLRACFKRVTEEADITEAQVITALVKHAFADIRGVLADDGTILPPSQWPEDIAETVEGLEVTTALGGVIKTKLRRTSKLRGLELLGRTRKLRLFVDQLEVGEPGDHELTDVERASRLAALLDRARARRARHPADQGGADLATPAGSAD